MVVNWKQAACLHMLITVIYLCHFTRCLYIPIYYVIISWDILYIISGKYNKQNICSLGNNVILLFAALNRELSFWPLEHKTHISASARVLNIT